MCDLPFKNQKLRPRLMLNQTDKNITVPIKIFKKLILKHLQKKIRSNVNGFSKYQVLCLYD